MSVSIRQSPVEKVWAFVAQPRTVIILWLIIAVVFSIQGIYTARYNNYLLFKYAFSNFIEQLPLYDQYPDKYRDVSHYGPLFSLYMAPFHVVHDWPGLVLWNVLNILILWWTIFKLPLEQKDKVTICWLALPELVGSVLSEQFNPTAGAFIMLSYIFVKEKKDGWAAFFIVAGVLIKLYGVVGLAFFFFSARKKAFIAYAVLWTVILFCLPMVFTSPAYVLDGYRDWFHELSIKNVLNVQRLSTQDVSVPGFFRRLINNPGLSNLPFVAAGALLFSTFLLQAKRFGELSFQLLVLAGVLITPIIFSSGSEDVTYIIAIVGVGIWFVLEPAGPLRRYLLIILLPFLLVPITIFPLAVRHGYPFLLAIKAMPYAFVWLAIIYRFHVPAATQEKNNAIA